MIPETELGTAIAKTTGSPRIQDVRSELASDLEQQGGLRHAASPEGLNSPLADGGHHLWQGQKLVGGNFADTFLNFGLGDSVYANGGKGNDLIDGGLGKDRLLGGKGADVFVFDSLADSLTRAPDIILDFQKGDRIDLRGIDANTALDGDQGFHLAIGGSYDIGGATVSYNAANVTELKLHVDDNDTVDAVIWLSGNHINLTANDFWFQEPRPHNGGRRRPVIVIGLGA